MWSRYDKAQLLEVGLNRYPELELRIGIHAAGRTAAARCAGFTLPSAESAVIEQLKRLACSADGGQRGEERTDDAEHRER